MISATPIMREALIDARRDCVAAYDRSSPFRCGRTAAQCVRSAFATAKAWDVDLRGFDLRPKLSIDERARAIEQAIGLELFLQERSTWRHAQKNHQRWAKVAARLLKQGITPGEAVEAANRMGTGRWDPCAAREPGWVLKEWNEPTHSSADGKYEWGGRANVRGRLRDSTVVFHCGGTGEIDRRAQEVFDGQYTYLEES